MTHLENAIVLIATCLQYGVWVVLAAAAVGLLISGLDWFLEGME